MKTRSPRLRCPAACRLAIGLRYEHASDRVRSVSLLPELKRQFAKPSLPSVKAKRVTNARAPIALDASHSVWPIASAGGIVCINGPHFTLGGDPRNNERGGRDTSTRLAALSLRSIHSEGIETAPSNQAFDRSLRDRNPNWGLRDLGAVAATAFSGPVITETPGSNLSVVFRRV